jgi:uncharacterized Zn finger protein
MKCEHCGSTRWEKWIECKTGWLINCRDCGKLSKWFIRKNEAGEVLIAELIKEGE